MRVKCLDQDNNAVPQLGLESGLLHLVSNALTIRPPHLQQFLCSVYNSNCSSLANIFFLLSLGLDGVADPTECSNLTTLELRTSVYSSYRTIAIEVLSWAFPGNKQYKNLTSLDLSGSNTPAIFPGLLKFPALKKLNLTNSPLPVAGRTFSLQSLPKFQNLEWLELAHCHNLNGNQLLILSDKVGKTLCYLGLAKQGLITDSDLRDLAGMFPVLKTLDLTLCTEITDAVLVEWYIKCNKSEWPQLRKLILTGCLKITQEVVDSVRLKTRNHLLIDTQLSKLPQRPFFSPHRKK